MAHDIARQLAVEQRKRLVASLMEYVEHEVYPALSKPQQVALRAKVLDAVGTYHDFVLDVVKVSRNDSVGNEEVLNTMRLLHRDVKQLVRPVP